MAVAANPPAPKGQTIHLWACFTSSAVERACLPPSKLLRQSTQAIALVRQSPVASAGPGPGSEFTVRLPCEQTAGGRDIALAAQPLHCTESARWAAVQSRDPARRKLQGEQAMAGVIS